MLYAVLLVIASLVLTVLGVSTLVQIDGQVSPFILVIPALWLLPQGGVAAWLLLLGVGAFGAVLPEQPIALSISLFMMLPVLLICTSPKGCWQLGALMVSIVAAMNVGLMLLQGDGKLAGSISSTLIQIIAIAMIWFSARSLRPVEGNALLPLALVCLLWVGGMESQALLALCITGLIVAMQTLTKLNFEDWIPRLSCILPAIGFATLVVIPHFEVDNPILVSWLLVLGSGLLGESLLDEPEEEED